MQKQNIQLTQKNEIIKNMFVLFTKSLFGCIVALGVFLCSIQVFLPKFSSKLFDSFGMNEASYNVYVRKYERTGDLNDLYNLIQKSVETKQYKKVIKYSNEMLEHDSFYIFSNKLNRMLTEKSELKYAFLVSDYENNLQKNIIWANYNLGEKETALKLALKCFDDDSKMTDFQIATYIECVKADTSLNNDEKKMKIKTFAQSEIAQGTTLYAMFDNKIILLYDEITNTEEDEYLQKSILCGSWIAMNEVQLDMSEAVGLIQTYANDDVNEEPVFAYLDTHQGMQTEVESILKNTIEGAKK